MRFRISVSTAIILLISFSIIKLNGQKITRPLRVGIYDNYPKIFLDEQGEEAGIYPELLNHIASAEKWDLVYVPGTWEECLQRLQSGALDIMPDVAYSEERARNFSFNRETVFNNWAVIYTRSQQDVGSLPDLAGKTVAVMKSSVHTTGDDGIYQLVERFGIHCEFLELDDYHQVLLSVAEDRAAAGVVNRIFGAEFADQYGVKKTDVIFNPIQLRFAFPPYSSYTPTLIQRIDEHLQQMKQDTESIYYQILTEYHLFPQKRLPEWVIPSLIGLVCLVILIAGANLMMKWRINLQTRMLQVTNTELKKEIEKHKATLADLELSRERFRSLLENSFDAIIATDRRGKIIFWNRTAGDIFSYKETEILGKPFSGLLSPDLPASRKIAFYRGFLSGKLRYFTLTGMTGEGKIIPIEVSISLIRDTRDQIISYLAVVRDISEQLQASEALRSSEEKFRSFVENIPGLVYMYDQYPDGHREPLIISSRNREFLGEELGERINENYDSFFDYILPEDTIKLQEKARAALESGSVLDMEYRLKIQPDQIKWLRSIGRVQSLPGNVTRWQGVMVDIDQRKKAEEELELYKKQLEILVDSRTRALQQKTVSLEKAYLKLQEADQLKSVFLASMSHELRTPLNSIIGFTGILLMGMVGELSEEQRKQLNIVKNSAHHLLELINDILDISKIEAGKVDLA
ncbi:MAG: PAS domain S-box protein, partial [Candidatus Cloacimonetes bacterium]|nr:PAS domain S-box protein [Candidatus Cloacimonadota bacterium]